jgi:hypothetical protein
VESRVSDLVREYTTLASGLLDRWSALGSRWASEVDAGTYTASCAVEDAAAGATLAAEAGWSWAELTWQAVATCCGREGEQTPAETHKFRAPAGAKLKLRRGFPMMGPGLDVLTGVTIEPEQLAPGETEFTLHAGPGACRGGTYVVEVEATTDDGTTTLVVGWITVL